MPSLHASSSAPSRRRGRPPASASSRRASAVPGEDLDFGADPSVLGAQALLPETDEFDDYADTNLSELCAGAHTLHEGWDD